MKPFKLAVVGVIGLGLIASIMWQQQARLRLEGEKRALQLRMAELEARLAAPAPSSPTRTTGLSDAEFRELVRLRGEVTVLRREQDDLLKQLAQRAAPARTASSSTAAPVDTNWVQQVLEGTPKMQGMTAGALRGKLLRRELTNVSPAELALRDQLLQRQLNQTLERSPADFADFQAAFIQGTLNMTDPARVQHVHDLIQHTYEQAVAAGLDIPSKPATAADDWVERRFALDRAATRQLQDFLTPEERALFDRAFLGVMGVDLGGIGVDKSNYPKRFLGE
jgi:hypothetical protein